MSISLEKSPALLYNVYVGLFYDKIYDKIGEFVSKNLKGKNNYDAVKHIKNSKPFKLFDLFLYAFILILVLALFLGFVVFKNKSSLEGFKVFIGQEKILEYSFTTDKVEISADYSHFVEYNKNSCEIKVYVDQLKKEFNVIAFDKTKRYVLVKESNCSNTKDCTHFKPLTDANGLIFCSPHQLKILPVGNGLDKPITG